MQCGSSGCTHVDKFSWHFKQCRTGGPHEGTCHLPKWGAVILVSTLETAKIRSNPHTGQYVSRVPSDHSHGQTLVEPLSLPGITEHINKFLCEAAQKMDSRLTVHTSGFDCDWLKVVIVKEAIYILISLLLLTYLFFWIMATCESKLFLLAVAIVPPMDL